MSVEALSLSMEVDEDFLDLDVSRELYEELDESDGGKEEPEMEALERQRRLILDELSRSGEKDHTSEKRTRDDSAKRSQDSRASVPIGIVKPRHAENENFEIEAERALREKLLRRMEDRAREDRKRPRDDSAERGRSHRSASYRHYESNDHALIERKFMAQNSKETLKRCQKYPSTKSHSPKSLVSNVKRSWTPQPRYGYSSPAWRHQ